MILFGPFSNANDIAAASVAIMVDNFTCFGDVDSCVHCWFGWGCHRQGTHGSEWIAWHEGCHLVTKKPEGCKTFKDIIARVAKYFDIELKSVGTRFNWYRDSSDWKPFHHDSAVSKCVGCAGGAYVQAQVGQWCARIQPRHPCHVRV